MAQIEARRYVMAHAVAIQIQLPVDSARPGSSIRCREQTVDVFVTAQEEFHVLKFSIFRVFSSSVT
jgi:hypothetical protein